MADGQHEVFVAITDDSGKILEKGEPIAFVKTAEAATMIPVSELQNNQSPITRSRQQYIFIAIIIAIICLVMAFILIGIVTSKRHLKEKID